MAEDNTHTDIPLATDVTDHDDEDQEICQGCGMQLLRNRVIQKQKAWIDCTGDGITIGVLECPGSA